MTRTHSQAWPVDEDCRVSKEVQTTCKTSIQIQDRDAFGEFCVALTNDHVPFSHRGFQTIVLSESQLANLPYESGRLYQRLQAQSLIAVSPVTSTATRKRRLPTTAEAKELLKKFAARREAR